MRAFGWNGTFFNESEMALFSECMLQCARNVLTPPTLSETPDYIKYALVAQYSCTIYEIYGWEQRILAAMYGGRGGLLHSLRSGSSSCWIAFRLPRTPRISETPCCRECLL